MGNVLASLASNAPLKNTILPFARSPNFAASASEPTSTTSAVIPPSGVGSLPPKAATLSAPPPSPRSVADSLSPRTQCGTRHGTRRTFSNPSRRMVASLQATAFAAPSEPLRRLPPAVSSRSISKAYKSVSPRSRIARMGSATGAGVRRAIAAMKVGVSMKPVCLAARPPETDPSPPLPEVSKLAGSGRAYGQRPPLPDRGLRGEGDTCGTVWPPRAHETRPS